MATIDEIRQIINRRLEASGVNDFYGKVVAVDESARTCTVEMEGIPYENVLLYAIEKPDLKGMVLIPKIGSTVFVSRMGRGRFFIAMFSVIDKILLSVGEKVTAALDAETLTYTNDKVSLKVTGDGVQLSADQITFNGGGLGGLVKIGELQKNIDSLKTFVEAIHAAVPVGIAAVGAALAANGALGKQAYDGAMAAKKIEISNMENTKIKQ